MPAAVIYSQTIAHVERERRAIPAVWARAMVSATTCGPETGAVEPTGGGPLLAEPIIGVVTRTVTAGLGLKIWGALGRTAEVL